MTEPATEIKRRKLDGSLIVPRFVAPHHAELTARSIGTTSTSTSVPVYSRRREESARKYLMFGQFLMKNQV